jgi:uncharacterized protein (TIGR03437 family)
MRLLNALSLCLLSAAAAMCQAVPYRISTLAGSGAVVFTGEGGAATGARLVDPDSAARDAAGNIYITDSFLNLVLRVSPSGVITRFAGTGAAGFAGDGGPALQAQLNAPLGIAVDAAGNVYVADSVNSRIRRIGTDGVISTVAGPQAPASVLGPRDLVLSQDGTQIYFSEPSQDRVRRLTLASGAVAVVAGTGTQGDSGEGGPAVNARLNSPQGLGLDKDGLLLIADSLNFKVKRVGANGNITTIAGNGQSASTGNGGSATTASLAEPADVFGAADGSIYISNLRNGGIRVVGAGGSIGNFGSGTFENPVSLFPLPDGGFLIVRKFARIVSRENGAAITPFAGISSSDGIGDGGPAEGAKFFLPLGVVVAGNGDVFIGDFKDVRVRRIRNGVISTVGTAQGEALAFDSRGRLHATNGSGVVRIEADGSSTRIAGTGVAGFSGDGSVANTARLQFAEGLVFDSTDTMYIADTRNHRVRRVDGTTGIITTLAGTGVAGYSGDGGAATAAQLSFPRGLAVGADGTLYIADSDNHRVRTVGRDGVIRTFAGTGVAAFDGEGGLAAAASLPSPMDVTVDRAGNVYISGSARTWMVDGERRVRTIAGTGAFGFSGDGGAATKARLFGGRGIEVDSNGVVYVVDASNQRVRRLEPIGPAKGLVHSASFQEGAIAPGQILSLFGDGFGPAEGAGAVLGPDGVLLTTIGGVQVTFNDVPGPIFFTNRTQVNVQAPYELAGADFATIKVISGGVTRTTLVSAVVAATPAIYSLAGGKGQIVALNQSGGLNGPTAPAKWGEVLVFFASGDGQLSPAGRTGVPAAAPLAATAETVAVEIGGRPARVLYGGPAPGFVGLMQLNVLVPEEAEVGPAVPIVLRVGRLGSPAGSTVAVGR